MFFVHLSRVISSKWFIGLDFQLLLLVLMSQTYLWFDYYLSLHEHYLLNSVFELHNVKPSLDVRLVIFFTLHIKLNGNMRLSRPAIAESQHFRWHNSKMVAQQTYSTNCWLLPFDFVCLALESLESTWK